MKKIRLFLVAMLMCMVTNGMAQTTKNVETRDYYRYAWLWVRIATKADGKTCYVILESSGLGHIQPPAVMKSKDGKSIVFKNKIDALNYLEHEGWEICSHFNGHITNVLARHKVTKEELDKAVKENTYYEDVAPKVVMNLKDADVHYDYE
ncbi:MAG: hypothetical protein HXO29_08380 [Prevotella sp.]|jgi:hypothetical protein|uniref:hypothetical protein n=1 Tax=Prevotella melaninogenica TaxID=28132 RepID=UPI001CAAD0E2|nr:hypothetical protein [Prevotella melaninogenica]MBF1602242.1 hypothetical protein [Prevotella sp.]